MSAVAGARSAEPATDAPLRGASRPRARAELPDRLEHPRRDRARGGVVRARTSCSRSAAASGCSREHLAERVAHVHVVEIDERLREALLDATAPHANVDGALGRRDDDRSRCAAPAADEGRREPALRDRRGTVLLRTIEELPGVAPLGGDGPARGRRAAGGGPGRRASTARRSVLAQLACEVRVVRAIPRTVFHPVPNVDSVLVGCAGSASRRDGARRARAARARGGRVRAPAQDARRLARAVRLAPRRSREQVRAALAQLGHPPDVRAERLSPEDFRALADCWSCERRAAHARALAPAKVNLGLFLGPVRDRGRPPRARHRDAVDLARRRADARAGAGRRAASDELVCPGVPGPPEENLAARGAAGVPRRHRLGGAAAALDDRQADPGRGRARRRLGRRGRDAAPGARGLGARRRGAAARARRASSAPTCRAQVAPGALAGDGRRRAAGAAARRRRRRSACSCCPPRSSCRRRGVRRGRPARAGTRPRGAGAAPRGAGRRARARRAAARPPRSCSTTTCSARRSRCAREIGEALARARRGGRPQALRQRLGADGVGLFAPAPRGAAAALAAPGRRGARRAASRAGARRRPGRRRRSAPRCRPRPTPCVTILAE